jgi:hypothetical protein
MDIIEISRKLVLLDKNILEGTGWDQNLLASILEKYDWSLLRRDTWMMNKLKLELEDIVNNRQRAEEIIKTNIKSDDFFEGRDYIP